MDFHEFLRSRRSVRHFAAEPVNLEVIKHILTTATFAPSAHNRQPWRFAVVSSEIARGALARAMAVEYASALSVDGVNSETARGLMQRSQARILSAPALIVLCMDETEMDLHADAGRGAGERTMAFQSTANAGTLLLLAAHAEGLGAVWNCAPLFAPEAVRTALDLPVHWEPQAMFLIGHAAIQPAARDRKPIEAVTIFR